MIKKLNEKLNSQVMSFLKEEPSINLFIIGDIESFGYDKDFQELWGDFSETGELRGVLLRFYDTYIPYGKPGYDSEGFLNIIKANPNVKGISGKEEILLPFEQSMKNRFKKQLTYFSECTLESFSFQQEIEASIKEAGIEDIDRILSLRETIQEFVPNPNAKEMMMKGIETKTARTYYIEMNHEMVACASTTAENSISAMVVGVCTHNDHRQKGYASLVVQKLAKDLLKEGKSLCLFYDNPKAGRIYHKIGFKNIGKWTMLR
ncbi:GNAT family N-acetyltransferase [Heyndrickxia acidicola]|uniref:GNAT family N-acetyltransferase n=1 Tax=Heyndrickxia acidicola TaxID=209389 RepID=A0ABU6MH85_9BACI|nr:GNAT family N-acetyltransferase [Heyndrickxia acidicola]MED1204038.1 GNAT family N-acetyltransferase [Heyndrickxia acidicola]